MTKEEFLQVFESDETDWEGDNFTQGLVILLKYLDPKTTTLIGSAGHDVVYGPDIDKLLQAGITLEDTEALRKLNWMVEDDEYLACFV